MATQSESFEKNPAYSTELPISDNEGEAVAQDDKDMARMGKKQEFKRNFNWISSVAFTSCTMNKFIVPIHHVFDADL